MSSYLSQPYQANQPFKDENFPLLAKVMELRQGKYDLAKSKMQQTLDAFGQIQVLRDIDNNYIGEKLNSVVSEVNDLGNLDLSRARNSDMLQHKIKSAAGDPIILNAIENTNIYRNYSSEVAKIKEKDPKLYNEANYQYGLHMGKFKEYMADTTGKANLKSLNYVPYTDVSKEELEQVKMIKDLKGKRSFEVVDRDNPNQKITKSIDGLEPYEIKQLIQSTMSPAVRQQLEINGMARYDFKEDSIKTDYTEFKNAQVKKLTADKELESKLPNNEAKVKDLELQISDLNKDITPNEMAFKIESASFVGGLASIAGAEWSTKLEVNEVYKLEQELEIKRQEAADKKAKETGVDAFGNSTVVTGVSPVDNELAEKLDVQSNMQDTHNLHYNTVVESAKAILAKMPTEKEKEAFKAALALKAVNSDFTIDKNKYPNASVADNIMLAMDKLNLKYDVRFADEYQTMKEANSKRVSAIKDIIQTDKIGIKETFEKNPDKYIDSFKNMLYTTSKATEDSPINIVYNGKYSRVEGFDGVIGNYLQSGSKDAMNLNKEMKEFLAPLKSVDDLKSYLKQNPDKLRDFAKILKKGDETWKGLNIFNNAPDANLMEDSKKAVNSEILKQSKKGTLATMTSNDNINIVDEGANKKIIGYIDATKKIDRSTEEGQKIATLYGQGGENFDYKQSVTYSRYGKNIIMSQNQGAIRYDDKGNLIGVKKAVTVLEPADEAYKEASKYISLEEDKRRGYNANTTTAIFPLSKVQFPETLKSEENNQIAVENRQSKVRSLNLKTPQGLPAFGGTDPSIYVTKESIKNIFTDTKNGLVATTLNAKFGQKELEGFSQEYLRRISGFKARPIKQQSYVNGQMINTWGIEIINDKGKTFLTKGLGTENLSRDVQYAIDVFPQMFITHEILQQLQNSSDKDILNTILDNGIKK